jgi:hypothetical protein
MIRTLEMLTPMFKIINEGMEGGERSGRITWERRC